jgi:hypothetical protein
MNPKNHAPAIKYRQLALAEPDKAEAHIPLGFTGDFVKNCYFRAKKGWRFETSEGGCSFDKAQLTTSVQDLPVRAGWSATASEARPAISRASSSACLTNDL